MAATPGSTAPRAKRPKGGSCSSPSRAREAAVRGADVVDRGRRQAAPLGGGVEAPPRRVGGRELGPGQAQRAPEGLAVGPPERLPSPGPPRRALQVPAGGLREPGQPQRPVGRPGHAAATPAPAAAAR